MAARKAQSDTIPPIVVIFGDDDHQKSTALTKTLDQLLPPEVDRSMALTEYDATRPEDQGGPTLAAVFEDLTTLPFLADRRVVAIREADSFITAHRERLEKYMDKPSATGTLVLECRTFQRNWRLAKAASAADGQVIECKKLKGRALIEYALVEAGERGKRISPDAVEHLVDLVGQDAGILAGEIEKLSLYAGDRANITDDDVRVLVGQSREEKIFAAMDAAAGGRIVEALRLHHQVLASDPAAVYMILGGMAWKVRQWLVAHRLVGEGLSAREIAPKVGMWGRVDQLQTLLRTLSPRTLRRLLAALGGLDAQAKRGSRSIDRGTELLLVQLSTAAAR